MLYRIENKGKEYGSYIKFGEFIWFVRETGSTESRRGTIVFLHGAPTQSYSYRVIMSEGFLVGSFGLTWALKNPSKILKLTILNNPLTVSSPIPGLSQKLRWDKPILLVWGISDKYLPQSVAEEFQEGNPTAIKLKLIEAAGHMSQEDWPEKVIEALRVYF